MPAENWRMPSGRTGAIDLEQPAPAVDALRAALLEAGGERIENENAPGVEPGANIDESANPTIRPTLHRPADTRDCGVAGCLRSYHDEIDEPADWLHLISATSDAGLSVEVYAEGPQQIRHAYIALHLEDQTSGRDAAGVRSFAATLQAHVDELTRLAQSMENSARGIRRPVNAVEHLIDLEG